MFSRNLSDGVVALMQSLIAHLERLSDAAAIESPILRLDRTSAFELYKLRQRRNKIFGTDIFGEPAWDMLLDLYIHAAGDRKVSVSSACIASNVPATTALRWLNVLADRGLIERERDPDDARRFYLKLTAHCDDLMAQVFDAKPVQMDSSGRLLFVPQR